MQDLNLQPTHDQSAVTTFITENFETFWIALSDGSVVLVEFISVRRWKAQPPAPGDGN